MTYPFFVTYAEEGHHVLAVFLINHVGASWKIVVESIAYLFAGSVLLGLDISAICAWEWTCRIYTHTYTTIKDYYDLGRAIYIIGITELLGVVVCQKGKKDEFCLMSFHWTRVLCCRMIWSDVKFVEFIFTVNILFLKLTIVRISTMLFTY